ncbi:MAG: cysteine--tRNA ligase [Candidatus Bilamarchaeaceae archaeon]
MQVYNTLSRKMEIFRPVEPGKAVIYVCGLTPYDHAHIGHARTYVAFDIIKRYLLHKKMDVLHIQNVTDVEDKIINRARERKEDPIKIAEMFQKEALSCFDRLNILRADEYPKVSSHIPEIVGMVGRIIENGYAYETKGGVYFETGKFPGYGKLSGQRMDEIKKGARVEVDEKKKDPADFALWKSESGEKDPIISYDSPWGKGRPGWHIECSAMGSKYSGGRTIDIHGGARDLVFPHHENEIAQSEAAAGKTFVKYWMHTGFLTVNGEKMSKSLGNFITVKDVLGRFDPNAIRLFFALTHYRSPIDYNEKAIGAAGESVKRIFTCMDAVERASSEKKDKEDAGFRKESDKLLSGFFDYMEYDYDTPQALASMFELVRVVNSHTSGIFIDRKQLNKIRDRMQEMLWILGLKEPVKAELGPKADWIIKIAGEFNVPGKGPEELLAKLIEERQKARKNREFKRSDAIRDRLFSIGIKLEDDGKNVVWKIIA